MVLSQIMVHSRCLVLSYRLVHSRLVVLSWPLVRFFSFAGPVRRRDKVVMSMNVGKDIGLYRRLTKPAFPTDMLVMGKKQFHGISARTLQDMRGRKFPRRVVAVGFRAFADFELLQFGFGLFCKQSLFVSLLLQFPACPQYFAVNIVFMVRNLEE